MTEAAVQPRAVYGQRGAAAVLATHGIIRCANCPDGLAHGEGARGGNDLAFSTGVGAVVKTLPFIRRAAKESDISTDVGDQEATIGIFEDIGVEFIRASLPCLAAGPIVSGNFIAVIRIRRKKIIVVVYVE